MDRIAFKINGKEYGVGNEISSDVTLLDYIRQHAELRGTKYMCREGGCGACIVYAERSGEPIFSVNSCLISITSCKDWEITTVEGIGNRLMGYHPVQKMLAENNGSQCGYCSPGWVMAMYSLLKQNKDLTKLEIEKAFGSNICRCTGYRPILTAFKKFAKDALDKIDVPDIENLDVCKKSGIICKSALNCEDSDWCILNKDDKESAVIELDLKDGKKWFRVTDITDVFNILKKEGENDYMLVNGNTAKGVYPIQTYPRILIDISSIKELKKYSLGQNLVIGAGVTLTKFMEICKEISEQTDFAYLKKFNGHVELVAHYAVRNVGTIGGNLMIKNQHIQFQSDIYLLLETVGALVTIMNSSEEKKEVTLEEFLATDMKGKVLLNVILPPLSSECQIVTYKIMPRNQATHAIVNAGFYYKLKDSKVVESKIVYGALSPKFTRALKTEEYLVSKDLFTNDTLQGAIKSLNDELVVEEDPPAPSASYRKQLAINLFYKGLLEICPSNKMDPRHQSGKTRIRESRPVSTAKQIYETDKLLWPLNQPIHKLEALIQCAGEATYTEDVPTLPREVFAAFALSDVAIGTIESIDPSEALAHQGVIAFYDAKSIPGTNTFTPEGEFFYPANEEVIASKEVKYFNQPIGIIVAKTRYLADLAAKLVKVKYSNQKIPVIDIKEAKKLPERNKKFTLNKAIKTGDDSVQRISGEFTMYGQYHFPMETLSCVTKPTEEGMIVYSTTQWMDGVHMAISRALKMDQSRIDIQVRRLGGGFGMKISRPSQAAVACALVTKLLNRPCRFIQSINTNMRALGKRFPCSVDYSVSVSKLGHIKNATLDIYEDNGYMLNETLHYYTADAYYNCYDIKTWSLNGYNTITDTAKNTFCRSPGTLEGIASAETVLERISYELNLDPFDVRLRNVDYIRYSDIKELTETLKTSADYQKRKEDVENFNKDNRWKKRGLRCSLLRWTPLGAQYFNITVSVYHGDGTVSITHSGIEMGQGVNTKAAQIAAYVLKIPLEKIQIKATNTNICPNGNISGGSVTSQNVGIGVKRACDVLNLKLAPIRASNPMDSWEEIVRKAYISNINLQAHGFTNVLRDTTLYDIYGASLAEVEVDLLTGEYEILRVDLIQDAGRPVSPELDIGQVEGAFIMGLGYWTCENIVMDPKTGEVLTDRPWHYHVPQARDIPQDFRVQFRKNGYSNDKIFGAKGTGEPSICMSIVVPFAIRHALSAAREEMGIPTTQWFNIDGPFTMEKVVQAAGVKLENLKFK